MIDYKLVPRIISPHMGHAMEAVLDDGGSMQAIWEAGLESAHQVQGEPVAYQWRWKTTQEGSRWRPWREASEDGYHEITDCPGPDKFGLIREARKLYTAPQPVEQQPATWVKQCGEKTYSTNDPRYSELWPDQWKLSHTATDAECGCCGQTIKCDADCDVVQDHPFEWEERYIVLKSSRLSYEQVSNIARLYGDASVTGVVVEKDWPEYEPVWSMIRDRVTRQPVPHPDEDYTTEERGYPELEPVTPSVFINGETLTSLISDPKRRLSQVWINPKKTVEDDTPLYTGPQVVELVEENKSLLKNLRGKHELTGATYQHLISKLEAQTAQMLELVEALEQIERWNGFPSTGKTWEGSGEPVSYGAAFGSNGERDFMRQVARKALARIQSWREPDDKEQTE